MTIKLKMLMGIVLAMLCIGSMTVNAETKFCWKQTWVTDASKTVIPDKCGANQERNGLFCYEKCKPGYTSNRIAGCIQNCPPGSTDDGLFCGWPSYKAAEYPIWDEGRCKKNHRAVGCGKIGLLWVENCKPGYKHILGFCEKKDINCRQLGLAGNRIANSCAKKTYGRAAQQAGCPAGTEFSAGLCYEKCGTSADRVGFVCWGKCPAGWVQCGMGCAKDANECRSAVTDQVVSVLDSVASTTLLVGSMGASAAGKNILSKAAWKSIKKIGKTAAKDVLKATIVGTAVNVPGNATKIASGTVDYIWNIGAIDDNTTMTQKEKDFAKAQLALDSIALFDPTGATGVVSAYTKPLCSDIAAGRAPAVTPPAAGVTVTAGATQGVAASLATMSKTGEKLNTKLLAEKNKEIAALKDMQNKAKDAKVKSEYARKLSQASKELSQIKKDLATSIAMQKRVQEWKKVKPVAQKSVCAPKSAARVSIDSNYYYRLTTRWQGAGKSLDILNDSHKNKPILAKTGNYSGQHWKIVPAGNGYYRLSTQWRGDTLSLDIVNDGKQNNRPVLAKTGNYSGQKWKLTPAGGGYYRLTTQWQGDCKALDIVNDGKHNNAPVLANGANVTGQLWKLSKTNVKAK